MVPNSPDLSPVDYAVYKGGLSARTYHTPISSLDDLKVRVHTHWENVD